MVHGLDTGFLVAVEVAEHAVHSAARQELAALIANGDRIAIAPQVLAESSMLSQIRGALRNR